MALNLTTDGMGSVGDVQHGEREDTIFGELRCLDSGFGLFIVSISLPVRGAGGGLCPGA